MREDSDSKLQASAIKTKHRLVSFDKTPLAYFFVRPQQASVSACAILVHGLGEHGGRYSSLAEVLAKEGVVACVPDLRGFGESSGTRAYVNNFAEYLMDIGVFHEWMTRIYPKKAIFILGHSMGGLIAYLYASRYREICQSSIQGVILSSPLFGIAKKISPSKNLFALGLSHFLPKLRLDDGLSADELTQDQSVCENYRRDPLVTHKVCLRLYTELLKAIKNSRHQTLDNKMASLWLQAGDDKIVSNEDASRLFLACDSKDKEIVKFNHSRHELLNDIEKKDVLIKIMAWIKKRIQEVSL